MQKLLIVDDDKFVQAVHEQALEGTFEIITADDGQEAVEKVSSLEPDAVLMDIRMPRLNGYDAAKTIRENGHQMPILFLSGLSSLEERLKAYDAGGNDFISKPAEPEEIIRKLSGLLSIQAQKNAPVDNEANEIAKQALSDLSYLGNIISFYRNSYACRSYEALAERLFKVTTSFDVRCSVAFRDEQYVHYFFDDGITKNIDKALLESLEGETRIMEFGHNRAAFNWKNCSLLVKTMPAEIKAAGSMKDYLAYLMDGVNQCATKISIEMRLRNTIEAYKNQSAGIQSGVAALIDELENQFEYEFSSAGFDEELSLKTEQRLLSLIQTAKQGASEKLKEGRGTERNLEALLGLFEGDGDSEPDANDSAELF